LVNDNTEIIILSQNVMLQILKKHTNLFLIM
jgi:hypothetical protein